MQRLGYGVAFGRRRLVERGIADHRGEEIKIRGAVWRIVRIKRFHVHLGQRTVGQKLRQDARHRDQGDIVTGPRRAQVGDIGIVPVGIFSEVVGVVTPQLPGTGREIAQEPLHVRPALVDHVAPARPEVRGIEGL